MVLLALAESIQLFPDGTLFIHIALILLMIWVLNRTFFKPINRVIASREKFKGGHNVEAEEILGSVAEKQGRYTAEMLEARTKGYQIVEAERSQAIAARSEIVSTAKAETAQTFDAERQALAAQAEAARAAIGRDAEVMADQISANILKA
jgi:F-type H+-transporting ATPase subunit b